MKKEERSPSQKAFDALVLARQAAQDANLRKVANQIRSIMLANWRRDAHRVINAEKNVPAALTADERSEGASRFYSSQSGADISHVVEELTQSTAGMAKKKKKTVVAESKNAALALIESKAYADMLEMDEDTLNALFGSLDTEKKWLDQSGYKIHPNAGREVTRKRTRLALSELIDQAKGGEKEE